MALPPATLGLLWVAMLSLLAFAACVYDKGRALRGQSRVRERTLLGLALLGGSPGLALGMVAARHKTRKASFLLRFAAVLLAQVAAVALVRWQGLL